jgi:hypothetical protein
MRRCPLYLANLAKLLGAASMGRHIDGKVYFRVKKAWRINRVCPNDGIV